MASRNSVSITYVPADCGSIIPGKSKAPKAFQDVGVDKRLRQSGLLISEQHPLESPAKYSALPFEPGSVRNEELNISVCQRVRDSVSRSLKSNFPESPFQLILGGECSMLPAVLAAFWQNAEAQSVPKRVGLVYIDADTDLASPADPRSTGNLAGMNMTHLIHAEGGLQSMKQFSRTSGKPVCDSSNTVLFGINMAFAGNKPEHFAYLFDNDYKVVSSASVGQDPVQRAKEALAYLEDRVDIIMVYLDVDSIDPEMFPLANLPNFTGVRFEQMMEALGVFLGSEKIGGLTVAEVNPDHDPELEMVGRLTGELVKMLAARKK